MNPWQRGRVALALVAASVALIVTTGALGDSAAARSLSPGGSLPPYSLGARPPAWLVTSLLATAVLLGSTGLALGWSALRGGWAPRPKALLAGSVVAAAVLCLVPPTGSDDVFSYTAYGRMVTLGFDPYTTTPNEIAGDPVADVAGAPWRDSPSVYGPVATGEQAAVMALAGDSVRTGAALLTLLGALAFLATVLVLDAAASGDDARRRALLLFGLNPLVLLHLVAGAHVDALLVLLCVVAVVSARSSPLLAGVLAGAATSTKLSGVFVLAGVAWWLRRDGRRLLTFLASAVAFVVPAYLAVGGLEATAQARRASRFVSFASPWRQIREVIADVTSRPTATTIVAIGALALFVALLVPIARRAPGPRVDVAAAALVPVLAWLLAATYVLPWYDAAAWSLLAMLPASRWDWLLLARTAVLSLAYLPGRIVEMPGWLADVLHGVRAGVTPAVLTAVLVAALVWMRRGEPHVAFAGRPPGAQ